MHWLVLASMPCWLLAAEQPTREIDARHWFKNPVYRLHDDRQVVLFFFRAAGEANSDETLRIVKRLNALSRRKDVVVIGLTPDSRSRVERFIEDHRVRFTVGAESRGARTFKIRKMPTLLRIDPEDRASAEQMEWATLDEFFPPATEEQQPQAMSEWPEESLRIFIESDARGWDRAAAVRRLYDVLEPAAFADYADSRLPTERDPWVRGRLTFFRDLALGISREDDRRMKSTEYELSFRANPDAAEWAPVRELRSRLKALGEPPPQFLLDEYRAHPTDEPADILVRRLAMIEISGCRNDRQAARDGLMEVLAVEPDPGVRMYAAMAMSEVADVGDTEAADLLAYLADIEPNVFRVKPVLEYVAAHLRTGATDTRDMPPGGP